MAIPKIKEWIKGLFSPEIHKCDNCDIEKICILHFYGECDSDHICLDCLNLILLEKENK